MNITSHGVLEKNTVDTEATTIILKCINLYWGINCAWLHKQVARATLLCLKAVKTPVCWEVATNAIQMLMYHMKMLIRAFATWHLTKEQSVLACVLSLLLGEVLVCWCCGDGSDCSLQKCDVLGLSSCMEWTVLVLEKKLLLHCSVPLPLNCASQYAHLFIIDGTLIAPGKLLLP